MNGCMTTRRLVRFPLVMVLLAALLGLTPADNPRAQELHAAEWERLPLDKPVLQVFAPASGPLFSSLPSYEDPELRERLYRGDDGGDTWAEIAIPKGTDIAAFDPGDPAVFYLSGPGGLYKSGDGGATLDPILATGGRIRRVAVSPADLDLVYVALEDRLQLASSVEDRLVLLRSRDGGASWEQLEVSPKPDRCELYVQVLYPHPTDPNRLYYQVGPSQSGACTEVGASQPPLRESRDQGASWSPSMLFRPREYPVRLAASARQAPARLYLLTTTPPRSAQPPAPRRSSLFRTDDDGQTWTEVAAFEEAWLSWFAADPDDPDRLYVKPDRSGPGSVDTSADGGMTWSNVERPISSGIGNLALGIDGRNLYAVTRDKSLWRLRLR